MDISLRRHLVTGERKSPAAVIARTVDALAARLRPRPDLSLIDVKFTDSLERELLAREYRRW